MILINEEGHIVEYYDDMEINPAKAEGYIDIRELNKQLDLYKRALEMACEMLKDVIIFCPKKMGGNGAYVAVDTDERKATCGKRNLLKCYQEYALTKAKEDTNEI
jgi:hypothetical protein